ncbi:PREDICTED: alanine aminotransferase 1 [Dinoponera quadriceps]|uniref:alanine transaminase n=1 Tax=Dinoponera quadriceps TaxID=609295 RepID=A0A6P3WZZ5_DINQU|nr:PREDICTED: alanine aminotransferase 1 [Dinoponera quadriceps]XP_014471675.1 PREDICTED: alanine aminotransferase 1 [Dinoponera quadriceps]XP_014471676.1 PREDICTED: alanine aminotransferase 1 [Dinoponera quadriceps]XP_014471677.1 PREDICTED: alanine aminotransferase 1 [Dinoponera quadriceps]XP_014471678.1 PREDICTED: alanine aminotransferase 1 [Dinoponera quadriceps]XP_014471679.1 PREDICTED: alanine aminotransferase 1 [Dinoponera quadriceps]
MSHARLRNAAIAGGWSSRTSAAAVKRPTRDGGSGALVARGVGTTAADRRAVGRPVSRSPMLLRPLIPCRGMAVAGSGKVLTGDNVFENLRKMEYAVRGPLLLRALEIEKELQKGVKKPFKEVIKANVGDAHAMGQQPITFLRQVLTLTVSPNLLDDPSYPEDAKERAKTVLHGCKGGSVGSYSESAGIECIRKHVAQYIQERDGIPCDYRNIILSNGASDGIKSFLKLFNEKINGKPSGVLIPIPQYPLYSATLAEFGLTQIGYYLNEENKWSLDLDELERALNECKGKCNPRVLVVINPGNPTGQVLTRSNIENIIRFAHKNHLFLLADEVYQDNIYDKDSAFHSVKKVMTEMGEPYSKMELASFMSISKGYMGECGIRGGYSEIINMDPAAMAVLLKSISAMLCPTVLGQVVMDVVVNPPRPNEPSYQQFQKEKAQTLRSLAERSQLVVDTLNSIPGFRANPAMGAMYVFPRFQLPQKAVEAAKAKGQEPDIFYAFKLLEATGICVIAGSGFGQKPGTYHFRTTILPQKEKIKTMLESLKQFHVKFLEEYS